MADILDWKYFYYEAVGSTNDEIKRFCYEPEQRIVVRAGMQTAGRGRRGRNWISRQGNLFFSLALEFDLKKIGYLVLISALSLAQVIEKINPEIELKLKWPNDVLLKNAKVSGILLEKGEGNYIIIGIGVNIASAPEGDELLYKAISLNECGIDCSADKFLRLFLEEFNHNLDYIGQNKYAKLQKEWLKRAFGINERIVVKQEKKLQEGIFIGIDENMALLLKKNEKIEKIMVGDVFLKELPDERI